MARWIRGSIVDLPPRLRHLRSLFTNLVRQLHRVSPAQYSLIASWCLLAQLLHTSSMSITDVGFASGFNSTRRFNDAFQKRAAAAFAKSNPKSQPSNNLSNHIQPVFMARWTGIICWALSTTNDWRLKVEKTAITNAQYVNDSVLVQGDLAKESSLDIEFELMIWAYSRSLIATIRTYVRPGMLISASLWFLLPPLIPTCC